MSDSRTNLQEAEDLIVEARDLKRDFPTPEGLIHALRGASLRLGPKEMVAITGPSGAGKSTLLFLLGLLLSPTSGTYLLMGRDVGGAGRAARARLRRNYLGFVFQGSDMVETGTVHENMELPLIYAGVALRDRRDKIAEALARVGMSHRMHHPANLLSGGERQRVAIARALVNRPLLILADEPTGQVDRKNAETILGHFQHIAATGPSSVVIVTHDPAVAARCTRIYRLEEGILHEP